MDIWSLGCITFVLLYGTFPFYEAPRDTPNDLRDKVISGRFTFPGDGEHKNHPISAEARDLISRAMVVDPVKRLDIDGFLAHPWMKKAQDAAVARACATTSTSSTSSDDSHATSASHTSTTAPLLSPQESTTSGPPSAAPPPYHIAVKTSHLLNHININNQGLVPFTMAETTTSTTTTTTTTTVTKKTTSISRLSLTANTHVVTGMEEEDLADAGRDRANDDDDGGDDDRGDTRGAMEESRGATSPEQPEGAPVNPKPEMRQRIRELFNTLIRVERARDEPAMLDGDDVQDRIPRRGVKLSDLLPSKIMQRRKQHRASSGLRIETTTRQLSSPRNSIGI